MFPPFFLHFLINFEFRCRIIGVSFIDGCYVLSLKQSILENKYQSMTNISPGEKVNAIVESIIGDGIRVSLDQSKFIGGFLPWSHASDAASQKDHRFSLELMEKRFPVGSKLRCRAMLVDPENNRMILTSKKRLVKSKHEILKDYSEIVPSKTIADGYIIKVDPTKGLTIAFYGGISGFVPIGMMPSYCKAAADLRTIFQNGQVVTCKAIAVEPERNRLILELVPHGEESEVKDEAVEDLKQLKDGSNKPKRGKNDDVPAVQLGQIFACKIIAKRDASFQVLLEGEKEIMASLPFDHLSDFIDNSNLLNTAYAANIKDQPRLEKVIVFANKQRILVSHKRSLIECAGEERFLKSLDEIQPGTLLQGWVKAVAEYGIFISFPGNVVGLAPKKFVADRFVVSPTSLFHPGQSVLARAMEIGTEEIADGKKKRQKFIVSLRLRDVLPKKASEQDFNEIDNQVNSFFEERKKAVELVEQWQHMAMKFPVGSVIESALVCDVGEEVKLKVDSDGECFEAIVPKELKASSWKGVPPCIGAKVDLVVIYHDYQNNRLEVSACVKLISGCKTKLEAPALPILVGQMVGPIHL